MPLRKHRRARRDALLGEAVMRLQRRAAERALQEASRLAAELERVRAEKVLAEQALVAGRSVNTESCSTWTTSSLGRSPDTPAGFGKQS